MAMFGVHVVSWFVIGLLQSPYGVLSSCDTDQCSIGSNWDAPINDFENYGFISAYSAGGSVSYDPQLAMYALKHAYASYATKEQLTNWECGCCQQSELDTFKTTYVIDEGHNQAYIGVEEGDNKPSKIVLTFRGTANTCGWVCQDFHFNEVKYPGVDGATIQEGYYKVWVDGRNGYLNYQAEIMPRVEALLREYSGPDCKILVTGHSLGAALAQVASVSVADLLLQYENEIQCEFSIFSFGGPRWGNNALISYFNDHSKIYQAWRLVNGYDVVPALPPLMFSFYHATTHVWYEQASPDSPYIGNPIDGEMNDHGHDLKECIFHSNACLMDHVKYLGYTSNNGQCDEVSLTTMSKVYNDTMALNRKSSRAKVPFPINSMWNRACEKMCV